MKNITFNCVDRIGVNESVWFLNYNLEQLKWEVNPEALHLIHSISQRRQIAIITAVEMCPADGCASDILNTLLGIKNNGFPAETEHMQPCIKMWGKPFVQPNCDREYIFLRAYGLFGHNEVEQLSLNNLRKSLMGLVMLLSSTVMICKNADIKVNWVKELE